MKKISTFLVLPFLYFSIINMAFSQKALVVGFNFDTPDGFSIVALEDLPASEVIFVTETGYNPLNNTFDRSTSNRGTWQITWTGTWAKGTVAKFEGPQGGTVLTGTSGPGGPSGVAAGSPYSDIVSFSSEGFSVFTSFNTSDPDAFPTEIYSYVRAETASGGADPNPNDDSNCPCSANFITVDLGGTFATDYGDFKVPLRTTPIGVVELTNPANWNSGSTNGVLNLDAFTMLNVTLPIELAIFQAKKENNEVKIKWKTMSETNNEYFSIEHSLDGTRFESIGMIYGAGNSFAPLNYSFMHTTPANGVNYYRLRQEDFDGAFEYSRIVSVNFKKHNTVITAYPNPFEQTITVEFSAEEDKIQPGDNRTIKVYDVYRRLVKSISSDKRESSVVLDLSMLPSGIYFLQTANGMRTFVTERIVKL